MANKWLKRTQPVLVALVLIVAADSNAAAARTAAQIFQQSCAPCHGSRGMGDGPAGVTLQPPPQPFSAALKDRDNRWIAKIVTGGGPAVGLSPMMPAQPTLSTDQVKALVRYVKGLSR